MTRHRTSQIAVGIIFILSLLVSSVSACTCSSHEHADRHTDIAAHHSHNKDEGHHGDADETSTAISDAASQGECCCVSPAPKVSTKSETIRIEGKHLLNTQSVKFLETEFVSYSDAPIVNVDTRVLLSDPHFNLSPGRAPPRL
ncbi:MAG TPA: hypothetical protein VGQ55_12725 [Pyrinomonadaceae bacterium]|jgi:hypothetical protein|nr:hypothetical protein [Pyrinomonadaceae bacterium]